MCLTQAQKSNCSHPSCLCLPSSKIGSSPLKGWGGVTAGLAESNGSLLPGLWLTSPAGWLARTGISSGTLRLATFYNERMKQSVMTTAAVCVGCCSCCLCHATLGGICLYCCLLPFHILAAHWECGCHLYVVATTNIVFPNICTFYGLSSELLHRCCGGWWCCALSDV